MYAETPLGNAARHLGEAVNAAQWVQVPNRPPNLITNSQKIMQANELQIGDWVYRPDCYDKVTEIRGSSILGSDHLRGTMPLTQIKPIPLTGEILNANGFASLGGYGLNRLVLEDERIVISANGAFLEVYSTSAHERLLMIKRTQIYVHTIQHALRLCGLNNLADNFKLKYESD